MRRRPSGSIRRRSGSTATSGGAERVRHARARGRPAPHEQGGDGEVVAVSWALRRRRDSLRKALAMGADRAVHVADDARPAPISSRRAKGSPRRSSARAPTSSSSASRRPTRTAPSSGPRSPTACGCRSSRRPRRSSSTTARRRPSARRSTATTSSRRRSLPWSPSRTRSTSRATRRSRGSWARRRSRRTSSPSPTSASTPDDVGEAGSRTEVYAVGEPPARGESRRIEDDGDAAEAILEYLAEKKLV